MSKERISASVDPEVSAFLSREDVNGSGLINKLVREHMNGGVSEDYLRKLREEQVRSEIKALNTRMETKQEELERIKESAQEQQQEQRKAIDERLEKLQNVKGQIDTTHPTVEVLARDYFGGSREEALAAMQDRNAELELVPEEYL